MSDETMIDRSPNSSENDVDDWSEFDFSSIQKNTKSRKNIAPKNIKQTSISDAQNYEKSEESHAIDEEKVIAKADISPDNRTQKSASNLGSLRFLLTGFFAGILVLLVWRAIDLLVIRKIFCGDVNTSTICANSSATAIVIATFAGGILTLILLRRQKIERALLISFAGFVSFAALISTLLNVKNTALVVFATIVFPALFLAFFAKASEIKNAQIALIFSLILAAVFWLILHAF